MFQFNKNENVMYSSFIVNEKNEIVEMEKKIKKELKIGTTLQDLSLELDQAVKDTREVLKEKMESKSGIKIEIDEAKKQQERIDRWASFKEWKIGKIIEYVTLEGKLATGFFKINSYLILQ